MSKRLDFYDVIKGGGNLYGCHGAYNYDVYS